MATLTELVDAIAAVEGLDRSTVSLIARYIREAGLITTGGRGTSAATMGLTDAANLLIAVNATATAADAPKTVTTYRKLESYAPKAKAHPTLGEAIEQLVHATAVGELPEVFLNRETPNGLQRAFPRGDVHIDMKFRRPIPSASLKIELTPELNEESLETEIPRQILDWDELPEEVNEAAGTPEQAGIGDEEIGVSEILFFAFCPPKLRGPPRKKKTAGDRLEEITIGYRTFSAVSKLIVRKG
jgi:hypothetical protein